MSVPPPPAREPPSDKYRALIADLARQDWAVSEHFLAPELVAELRADIDRRWSEGDLRRAAIGRGDNRRLRGEVRGDYLAWLDGEGAAQQAYLRELDALRLAVNGALFLGLFEYEAHLALYPPGACYRRHLDRHQDSDSRVLSCVVYLNEDWRPEHGGELRLFLGEGPAERALAVAPRGGTLVCFLSASVPHEVLPARAPRYSITGWFRRREIRPPSAA